jgi:serine/threonine-protein kinase
LGPDRWAAVERLYHAALTRPRDERAAYVADACAGDEELRREVESLLAQGASAVAGLTQGAVVAAAGLVTNIGRSVLTGRLGGYQILGPLGAGGMGEVYRARDTRLGRDVAIKILPRAFTADPSRLARFEREARVLAALNHPHIAAIYGVEKGPAEAGPHQSAGPTKALILELVEGETLAERIGRAGVKGLPLKEVLDIARQIADALDAAHEKGIVHRDLKPANIKITPQGVVKVLDFGLAKLEAGEAGRDVTEAPTFTVNDTHEGLIVGTAAYMSPEQARGQAVDKRTDIWAFGCVLYEMLTGRAAFARPTVTDTLAAIVEREPDLTLLPESTPSAVARLVRRCLDKDPKRRLRDVGEARMVIEEAQAASSQGSRTVNDSVDNLRARYRVLGVVAAAVAIGAIGASVWLRNRPDLVPASITRTTVTLPVNQELDAIQTTAPLALSQDGRLLAYVASSDGSTRLYVRSLDAFDAKPLEGTEGARYPFFAPDGQSIGFFAAGKLKRVSISGGAPVVICDVPDVGRGGTWGSDGTIVFDPGESGLLRISAQGGQPMPITSRDPVMDARNHSWPQFLPDGRGLLTTVEGVLSSAALASLSFESGEWHVLGPGSQAQYLSAGYLVYHAAQVREGQLDAMPFDLNTFTVRGMPVSVLDGAFRAANGGAAFFAVARTGMLIFAPGGFARRLVRVDLQGHRVPLTDDRRGFRFPKFSPDGRKVAVTIDPRPSQIWVYDLDRGSRIPLTTEGHNLTPLWTADGQRVAFSGSGGISWRAADGSSPAEPLIPKRQPDVANINPTSWSADGRFLFFHEQIPGTDFNIWVAPRGEAPRVLIATTARDLAGTLSPDGRWLAYYSNESGRPEVYVRPFPNVNDHRWTVSTSGGWTPRWSPDGRQLFYMNGASMLVVHVETQGADFVGGKPQFLFDGPFDTTQDMNVDIAPDGRSFVMVEADPDAKPTKINVILNWSEDVARIVRGAH